MLMTNYGRPPVVEAVVELRFAGVGTADELAASRQRLLKNYPRSEDLRDFQVRVVGSKGEVEPGRVTGHRLVSADGDAIIQLHLDRLAVSTLAPYSGWESLMARTRDAVKKAAPLVGGRALTRVATRFINRIDIPAPPAAPIDHGDYLKGGVEEPPIEHGGIGTMFFNISTTLEGEKFGITLNGGRVPAPLIGQVSILFDIDLFNQVNLPKTRSALWEHLAEMRTWKNRVFEACITDRARELFK